MHTHQIGYTQFVEADGIRFESVFRPPAEAAERAALAVTVRSTNTPSCFLSPPRSS